MPRNSTWNGKGFTLKDIVSIKIIRPLSYAARNMENPVILLLQRKYSLVTSAKKMENKGLEAAFFRMERR